MRVPDICNHNTYTNDTYPKQIELPDRSEESGYIYVRCFFLKVSGVVEAIKKGGKPSSLGPLGFRLSPAKRQDRKYGTRLDDGISLDDRLNDLMSVQFIKLSTPMDFDLVYPTRVVILLRGGKVFRFPMDKHPLTSKHDYFGRYSDLKYHYMDNDNILHSGELRPGEKPAHDYNCFSFSAGKPCVKGDFAPNIRHGFTINLMQFIPGYGPVPVAVDPDIENKGDPPPHPLA